MEAASVGVWDYVIFGVILAWSLGKYKSENLYILWLAVSID